MSEVHIRKGKGGKQLGLTKEKKQAIGDYGAGNPDCMGGLTLQRGNGKVHRKKDGHGKQVVENGGFAMEHNTRGGGGGKYYSERANILGGGAE